MPDHLHVLLTPGPITSLERAVQFIKGGSSRTICQTSNSRLPVWQRGFSDHRIRDVHDYESHVRYIAQNPVRRRLVQSATEYPWSSPCGRFPMDEPPQGLKPLTKRERFGTVETVP
jgi:putative transposase